MLRLPALLSDRMDCRGDDDGELCRWASLVRATIICFKPCEATGAAVMTVLTSVSGAGQQQK